MTPGAAAAAPAATASPRENNNNNNNNKNNSNDDDLDPSKNGFANKIDLDIEQAGGPQGIMKFIFAAGFWRNPEDIYWVPRFGMLFDRYTEKYKTWLVWETIFSFVLGILDGIAPDSTGYCKAKAVVVILMYTGNMLLFWVCRPFRRALWNTIFSFCYFLMFLAAALIGDEVMNPTKESTSAQAGMDILFFHAIVLLVMAIVDLLLGMASFVGVQKLLQLRVTGRIDKAKEGNANDDLEEMKTQMKRQNFVELVDSAAKQQAIDDGVAEKRLAADIKMKSGVRNLVNAESEFNRFAVDIPTKAKPVEFSQEDMDFI